MSGIGDDASPRIDVSRIDSRFAQSASLTSLLEKHSPNPEQLILHFEIELARGSRSLK